MDEFKEYISVVLKDPSKKNLDNLSHCQDKLSKTPLKYMLDNLKRIISETSKETNKYLGKRKENIFFLFLNFKYFNDKQSNFWLRKLFSATISLL